MKLSFTKMQGCANDYIYLDCRRSGVPGEIAALSQKLSRRHFSIGADGIICICAPVSAGADGMIRIFNADGSEGKMCGNGIRCVAEWLYTHGTAKETLAIDTLSGLKTVTHKGAGLWQVEMGAYSVVPVAMEHSVVRLDGAKAAKKVERWQKIAESAAKQSKRDIIPEVQPVQTMAQMLAANDCATKIIAYECEDKKSLKAALKEAQAKGALTDLLLIIGPEGGISEAELDAARAAGAVPVSLGRRILRAETAGLVAISAIFYETGDLGD